MGYCGPITTIGREISLREKCALSSITSTSRQIDKEWRGSKASQHQPYRKQQPTVSTLVSENRSQQVPSCLFCSNKHFSASCTKVTDPDKRKRILRELRRCFVCLKSGHIGRDCNSRSRCFHCQRRHHSSICGSRTETPRTTDNHPQAHSADTTGQCSAPVARPSRNMPQTNAQRSQVSTNLYTSQHINNQTTLLQTARAQVHKVENPSECCNVRVILDACSQKSYITTRLRDRLNLPTVMSNKVLSTKVHLLLVILFS